MCVNVCMYVCLSVCMYVRSYYMLLLYFTEIEFAATISNTAFRTTSTAIAPAVPPTSQLFGSSLVSTQTSEREQALVAIPMLSAPAARILRSKPLWHRHTLIFHK